ncbi:MAG TPA: hypothetical protein DD417_14025 [Elusimicrobia bacterium]|nr:hypothetical protein [Elusimicrobiota bacterium]
MSRVIFLIAVFAVTGIAGCAGPETRVLAIADRIPGPGVIIRDPDKLDAVAALFGEEDLSEANLRRYSDKTIALLYRSLRRTTFYLPEQERYIVLLRRLLAEHLRRGTQTDDDVKNMYKAYLGARMFESAGDLRKQFPGLAFPATPEIVASSAMPEATRWRAYEISEGGGKAELTALPLGQGAKIVVVMFPGCSVAERALTEVLGDAEFADRFKANGLLVTERFDSVGVAKWKSHFNFDAVYITSKASDFPGLDFRSSPQFYFLEDGKVVYHFEGWDTGKEFDTAALLRKGLKALRL